MDSVIKRRLPKVIEIGQALDDVTDMENLIVFLGCGEWREVTHIDLASDIVGHQN